MKILKAFAAGVIVLAGCSSPDHTGWVKVDGYVTNSVDGDPVSGIVVDLTVYRTEGYTYKVSGPSMDHLLVVDADTTDNGGYYNIRYYNDNQDDSYFTVVANHKSALGFTRDMCYGEGRFDMDAPQELTKNIVLEPTSEWYALSDSIPPVITITTPDAELVHAFLPAPPGGSTAAESTFYIDGYVTDPDDGSGVTSVIFNGRYAEVYNDSLFREGITVQMGATQTITIVIKAYDRAGNTAVDSSRHLVVYWN